MLSWWNALWASEIPPKIKIFWWRIVHNIIPTSWNLRNNHIPASLECKLCGFGYETTSHALFWCPLVKRLWKSSVFGECLQMLRSASIVDLLTWARHRWNKEQIEVFMVQVWEMWNLRNDIIHGKQKTSTGNEMQQAEMMLVEYKRCRPLVHNSGHITVPRDIKWTVPPRGCFRLDVDAGFDEVTGDYTAGGIIRDDIGSLIDAASWPKIRLGSVGQAEVWAIKLGLKLAKDQGISNLHVYSDSLGEIQKLNDPIPPINEDGFVFQDIRALNISLSVLSFSHMPRSCNSVAHTLARHVFNLSNSYFWTSLLCPSWLSQIVLADLSAI
ncbi:hypothetical protein UlMin_006089 [Ulmus minor]